MKDPEERWQSIRDVHGELKWIAAGTNASTSRSSAARKSRGLVWLFGLMCIGLLLGLALAYFQKPAELNSRPMRLSLLPPQGTSFVPYNLAISPDGQRLAFVAAGPDGETGLWIRSLAAGNAEKLSGTEGALFPFWSGDSRQIGFFADGKMKTIEPSSGAIEIVCNTVPSHGATWNDRGDILFAPEAEGPLYRISASGGLPIPATKATGDETDRWSVFLPDGDHFLYFADNSGHSNESTSGGGIYVASLSSTESRKVSAEIANNIQFASSRIFFVRDRSLMAQDFDLKRFQLSSVPKLAVAEELESDPAFSRASFSVSKSSIVVFQSAADNLSRLTWFDREGNELEVIPGTGYRDPSLSRDGTLLAVSSDDERNGKHDIRVYDFGRATSTRVSAGGADTFPAIQPDGTSVAYLNGMKKRISVVAADNAI